MIHTWREAGYFQQDDNGNTFEDKAILTDTNKWAFFGCTLSRGKKNNHVFHEACLTHIIKYYDSNQIKEGKQAIPTNVIWTDQCPTQYKCWQNFWNIATLLQQTQQESVRKHKFAAKYQFKGSWDAFSKHIKAAINSCELRDLHCENAFSVYINLRQSLTRDGNEETTKKLLEFERKKDICLLKNTTLQTNCTFIGYATESKSKFDQLSNNPQHDHIVFTDRDSVPNMKHINCMFKIL